MNSYTNLLYPSFPLGTEVTLPRNDLSPLPLFFQITLQSMQASPCPGLRNFPYFLFPTPLHPRSTCISFEIVQLLHLLARRGKNEVLGSEKERKRERERESERWGEGNIFQIPLELGIILRMSLCFSVFI